ncbi:zona pellucida-binding protein 2 isoform X2 [Bufo gargarizans]|uniref:zona pellucida-binding protein 2 isoform X2 n=1 Tax=Bufo gargarizans TaxID=30331 RepID=UPI001CF1AFF1|nr:zona pellucida-binding protein 2 isoform X2 [Bufo gargarizans]
MGQFRSIYLSSFPGRGHCNMQKASCILLNLQMVYPFSVGWDKDCSRNSHVCQKETSTRLEKAKTLIVEFFRMQSRVLEEEFLNIPEINYIEHSLDIIRVDSCRPGFGKNQVTHHDCPGCCVFYILLKPLRLSPASVLSSEDQISRAAG